MIEFRLVSKRHGAQIVLDSVSFRLPPGSRTGVVGPNGAGKTTLFDLAAGEAEPDSGQIVRRPGLRIGYLRQQLPSVPPGLALLPYVESAVPGVAALRGEIAEAESALASAAPGPDADSLLARLADLQTRYENAGAYDAPARAAAALAGLGFRTADLDRPLRSFSGGWQMRAALARALLADPDLLLLDEPGNYLDLPAIEWLRRRLESYRGTLAMVSHDRYLLQSLARVTLEVARGSVVRYPGPYSFYAAEREKRRALEIARRKNEDRRRREIERFVERFRAKATLAARVQAKIKLLEKMPRTEVSELALGRATFRLAPPPPAVRDVLRAEDISFRYAPGAPWIYRGISLEIRRGDKIALVGPNGAGKTTLLRTLAAQLAPETGRVVLGRNVVPGYQAQDSAETLPPVSTCFDILRAAAPDAPESEIRSLLGAFGFSGDAIRKQAGVLSGGERIRLAFARLLVRPPNLLLLDEPTTHLDLESREALQAALEAYEGTYLLVSHDVAFVRAAAREILELRGDARLRRYPGNYDYYRECLAREASAAPVPSAPPPAASPAASPAAPATEKERRAALRLQRKSLDTSLRKLDRQLADLETRIAAAEDLQTRQHALLADPSTPPDARAAAGRLLKQAGDEIADLTARWESLGAERDALASSL